MSPRQATSCFTRSTGTEYQGSMHKETWAFKEARPAQHRPRKAELLGDLEDPLPLTSPSKCLSV